MYGNKKIQLSAEFEQKLKSENPELFKGFKMYNKFREESAFSKESANLSSKDMNNMLSELLNEINPKKSFRSRSCRLLK
jgi:hypothetical protein